MAESRNDIVINTVANTKDAEASIKKLDAKIIELSAADPKLQQLGRDLSSVSGKAQETTKYIQLGFSVLQGNLQGVITKLGSVGLAIGALKIVWETFQREQQRHIDNLKGAADASNKYFTAVKDQTKSILDNLEKLDKLADGGYLDDNSIQQTNNLVSQLNDLWGDVGLSVDQATGKVNGLQSATEKITEELKAMALQQAKLEEDVAQAEYDEAQRNYSRWYDENGRLQNEAMGMFIAGNWTGDGDTYKAKLDNKRKTAKANLLAVQQRRKQLESSTTTEEINDSIAAAEAQKTADEAAKKDAAKTKEQLTTAQASLSETPDWKLFKLQYDLAIAQATGGDVTGTKAAVDAYTQERDIARFNQLEDKIKKGVKTYNERVVAYNKGLADKVDEKTLLELTTAVNEITDSLKKDAEEFNRLGTRLEQQEKPIEEPETEVLSITKAIANGTFSAYGIDSLKQVNIEQEQLRVQKEIAANTRQLAKPVVGE